MIDYHSGRNEFAKEMNIRILSELVISLLPCTVNTKTINHISSSSSLINNSKTY